MDQKERLDRIDEVDRYCNWLTDNDPHAYVRYHYDRTRELDALAAPILPGEMLEIHVGEHRYSVEVIRAL